MTANQIQLALASLGYIVSVMIYETNNAIGNAVIDVGKLSKHVNKTRILTVEMFNSFIDTMFDYVFIYHYTVLPLYRILY